MTKGQSTIVALLAVVAVMLGLNLLNDPVVAQGSPFNDVVVVGGQAYPVSNSFHRVWRFWSDGSVDTTNVHFTSIGTCITNATCGPVLIVEPG